MKKARMILFSIITLFLVTCLGCQNTTMDSKEEPSTGELKSVAVWYYDDNQKVWYDEAEDIETFVNVLKELSLEQTVKISDMPPRYPGLAIELSLANDESYKLVVYGGDALAIEQTNTESGQIEYAHYTVDCMDLINLAEQKRTQHDEKE